MTRDKKIIYIIPSLMLAVLFAALFINVKNGSLIAVCILIPFAIIVQLFIKKRSTPSINKRDVLLFVAAASVIYVILIEASGMYFGFYKNPYFVSGSIFLKDMLPIAVTIILCELIRYALLSQRNGYVSVVAFLSCVAAEIVTSSSLVGITSINRFMDLVGMTLFPALIANVFYHHTCKLYGPLPNVVFRLITTLYVYFFPTVTAMNDAIGACIKIVLPIVMLALVTAMFSKEKKNAVRRGRSLSAIATALTVIIVASVAMLISCQFRFGALVIATDSMTGEINKGDMIIYEQFDGQKIEEGQVIVFLENESKIVHRVVKIEDIGGELRYYTKGDANEDEDAGYRLESDIVGLTDIKVAYIGYPTLWLRELIQN